MNRFGGSHKSHTFFLVSHPYVGLLGRACGLSVFTSLSFRAFFLNLTLSIPVWTDYVVYEIYVFRYFAFSFIFILIFLNGVAKDFS